MRTFALLGAALLLACKPDLGPDDSLVTFARVLAIKGEPPEAKPGVQVSYTAYVADPEPPDDAPALRWSFCSSPKPPSENNAVSGACLEPSSLVLVGSGSEVVAATPANACALFGPTTPRGGFRPRDPDVTGGYYVPLRVDLSGTAPAFHLARIFCALGDAPADLATQFGQEYVLNANPHLAPIEAAIGARAVSLDAIPLTTRVDLSLSWSEKDVETYSYFDRGAQRLASRREAMRVAWHVSAGRLATEATGRTSDDLTTTTSNVWTSPDQPGEARLWLVLRDDRGGVDFAEYAVTVTP